jgi:hypothetical protein
MHAALAALGALLLAPDARAGALAASATGCQAQSLSQPFLPWADPAQYTLAPGGAAESADGWQLTGPATISGGNEPWLVHSAQDARALSLGAGATATTGAICVGLEHPTLRFFATGGDTLSALRVDVLFEDASGAVQTLTIGRVAGGGAWQPTAVMPIVANLLATLPGDRTAVAFSFTTEGTGSWAIDDVYVDPFSRG